MFLDNPESLIYKPNYKPPEVQNREKKQKQKQIIEKSLYDENQLPSSLMQKLERILEKGPETRTSAQNNFIHKYVECENISFLTKISELTNLEVAKNLLKSAHIHEIPKNRLLAKSKQQITRFILILQGTFGSVEEEIRSSNSSDKEQISEKQILESIINKAGTLLRDVKRKWKTNRDDFKQLLEFKTTKANLFQLNIKKNYKQDQLFNLLALKEGKYSETLVSCSAGKILSISYKAMLEIFTNYVKTQKSNKISIFRKFQFFNAIENDKLLNMVDELPMITKVKNQYIYNEGDSPQSIYILLKGSIKLTKSVELFKQNPNCLYKNRQTIKGTTQVEHADFSQIYNYKPKNKIVELGVISDLCIFGEQQIVCDNNFREVNVQVASQEASYYKINLKNLETIMMQKKSFIQDFKKLLYRQQTQKKILYRQEKLGEILMLQNKTNMDYFYLEEEKPYNSAENNKFKISRLNNFISTPKVSPSREKKGQKAQYNIFNFTKLSKKKPESGKNVPSLSINSLNKDQEKVMQLVHTVGLNCTSLQNSSQIKNKNYSLKKSKVLRVRSHIKHSIDIFNPLFSISYFEKTHRENVKIEKESRMRPLTTTRIANKSFSGNSTIR